MLVKELRQLLENVPQELPVKIAVRDNEDEGYVLSQDVERARVADQSSFHKPHLILLSREAGNWASAVSSADFTVQTELVTSVRRSKPIIDVD